VRLTLGGAADTLAIMQSRRLKFLLRALIRAAVLVMLGWSAAAAFAQEILELGSKPGHIRIEMVHQPVGVVAERIVRLTGIRIEGRERLGDTLITLQFQDVPVDAVVGVLAHAAGLQHRRGAGGAWRVGRPDNQDAIEALAREAERARKSGNDAALERALTRILDLAPSAKRGGMDALPSEEVEELTRLLRKRGADAEVERVQRRWLALAERNQLTSATAEAVLMLGQFRVKQRDFAQANALLKRAMGMASLEGVSRSLATRVQIGLAELALQEGRTEAAEAHQAQAFSGLKAAYQDDFDSVYQFHDNDGELVTVAFDARDYVWVERILSRREDLYQKFSDTFSVSLRLVNLNALGHYRSALGRLAAARDAYTETVALAERTGKLARAEHPEAIKARVMIDLALGRYQDALSGWRQFCGLLHAILGRDHPSTVAAVGELVALGELAALDELAAPTPPPRQPATCPAATPAPVPDSPLFASMLGGKLFSEADVFLWNQLEILQRATPPALTDAANLLDRRAMVRAALGMAPLAASDLIAALRIRIQQGDQGVAHEATRLTARRLAAFYDLRGQRDLAREVRRRWRLDGP
jgi:tetratricopeptide (TPR) repeat protein